MARAVAHDLRRRARAVAANPARHERTAHALLAVAILAGTLVFAPGAGARNRAPSVSRSTRAHIAVIGGQAAEPGTFPWMAYVLDFRGNQVGQCSGTVVAANLVLTAGHCAEDMQTGVVNEASGYRVVTATVDWAVPETERQTSHVTRVIVCPCFDRHTTVGDAALLQLSTPTTAPAVTLASTPHSGTTARMAGWGDIRPQQQTPVEQLQWAPTALQRPGWCEREATPFSPVSESCVVDPPQRQTGGCYGDSGGPLLVPEPSAVGGMVQIGIASHVYGECATSTPSVFTRVDALTGWIRGWAQALASSASPPPPSEGINAPILPGVATSHSITVRGNAISLVLSCDSEGGTCTGSVEAAIRVREELVVRRYGIRTISTSTHRVTLASAVFAIAAGASITLRSRLSTQDQMLLSHLGHRALHVLLTGRGIAQHVATLQPTKNTKPAKDA